MWRRPVRWWSAQAFTTMSVVGHDDAAGAGRACKLVRRVPDFRRQRKLDEVALHVSL